MILDWRKLILVALNPCRSRGHLCLKFLYPFVQQSWEWDVVYSLFIYLFSFMVRFCVKVPYLSTASPRKMTLISGHILKSKRCLWKWGQFHSYFTCKDAHRWRDQLLSMKALVYFIFQWKERERECVCVRAHTVGWKLPVGSEGL